MYLSHSVVHKLLHLFKRPYVVCCTLPHDFFATKSQGSQFSFGEKGILACNCCNHYISKVNAVELIQSVHLDFQSSCAATIVHISISTIYVDCGCSYCASKRTLKQWHFNCHAKWIFVILLIL